MPPKGVITQYPSSFSGRCGQEVSFTVTVKNEGDETGVFHLYLLDANGNQVWSLWYSFGLEPGEERTISDPDTRFRLRLPSGTYKLVLYDETTHTNDDEKDIPANISGNGTYGLQSDVFTEKTEYNPGETVNITVVVNGIDCCTAGEIRVKDSGGNVVSTAGLPHPVCPNENLNIPMSFNAPDEPGTYTYVVETYDSDKDSVDDSDEFTITVTGGGGGGAGGGGEVGGGGKGVWVEGLVVAFVIAVVLYMLYRLARR